jgi:predicted transcriptional regulator
MLNDYERKLLRILHNFQTGCSRNPSIKELVRKTGRSPWQIHKSLQSLADKQFIVWDPEQHENLQVIKAWEEERYREPTKKFWEYD